jgi:kynurenine 3-monooxygenase
MPVYSMVTFSNTPYEQALREDDAQNELFKRILTIPNIAEKWDGPEIEAVYLQWRNK